MAASPGSAGKLGENEMNRRELFTSGALALAATQVGAAPTVQSHADDTKPVVILYIPPSLDCELLITASSWPEDLSAFPYGQRDGVPITYRRAGEIRDNTVFGNIAGSRIQAIEVLKVAPRYERWLHEMPDTSRFFYSKETDISANPSETEKQLADLRHGVHQQRGYLKYPIANPTPGDMLFTALCSTRGQSHTLPECGCQSYEWFDEAGNGHIIDHPIYTRKCILHSMVS
jgi:hypothetical protein